MKYVLLNNAYKSLTDSVNDHLKDGWKVFGFPFHSRNGCLHQAMIKGTKQEIKNKIVTERLVSV